MTDELCPECSETGVRVYLNNGQCPHCTVVRDLLVKQRLPAYPCLVCLRHDTTFRPVYIYGPDIQGAKCINLDDVFAAQICASCRRQGGGIYVVTEQ